MSINVRIPYKMFYLVPPNCVCCGSSKPTHFFHVSHSDFVSTSSIKFPLCDRCNALIDKRKGSCLIFFVSLLVFVGVLFLFQSENRYPENIITSTIVSLLLFLFLRFYVIHRGRKDLTQEEIIMQNKALQAVRIVRFPYFSITFKFENEYYGMMFAELNGGKIIRQ